MDRQVPSVFLFPPLPIDFNKRSAIRDNTPVGRDMLTPHTLHILDEDEHIKMRVGETDDVLKQSFGSWIGRQI